MRDCYSLDAGLEQKYRTITPCNCGTRQARKTKQFAKHIGKKSLCPSVRLFHQIFKSFRHETCFLTPRSLSLMKPGFLNDDNAFALTFSYCHIVAHTKLPEATWWIKSNAHNNINAVDCYVEEAGLKEIMGKLLTWWNPQVMNLQQHCCKNPKSQTGWLLKSVTRHKSKMLHNTSVPKNYDVNKNFPNNNNVTIMGSVQNDQRNAHSCHSLVK